MHLINTELAHLELDLKHWDFEGDDTAPPIESRICDPCNVLLMLFMGGIFGPLSFFFLEIVIGSAFMERDYKETEQQILLVCSFFRVNQSICVSER